MLWDFGVRPIGVFAPQRTPDGSPEPAAGRIDLDAVESAKETWEGVNLEVLAAMKPDLVVSGGTDEPWIIAGQIDEVHADVGGLYIAHPADYPDLLEFTTGSS